MSQSPRRSINGGSPVHERSRERDPSFSRSRSRSGDRRDSYKHSSSRRSPSPRYSSRDDRYKEERHSSRRRYSRSPSYSRDRKSSRYDDRGRSRSRSPMSSRRRHHGSRENPVANKCLGIFGLSLYTTERQLHHLFSKYGPLAKVQVVLDAKTGRSRGFSFIYFEHTEDAAEAKEQCTGMEIDGRRIRVDFSITERAHTPTPGIYMGDLHTVVQVVVVVEAMVGVVEAAAAAAAVADMEVADTVVDVEADHPPHTTAMIEVPHQDDHTVTDPVPNPILLVATPDT
ncbi:unnamed protein product, partial [Meganyctiphanes norvegica]